MNTIWTIGHSTLDLTEFLDLLKDNEIQLLADVRSYPGSRWVPHFGRISLRESLAAESIQYLHIGALGGRRSKQRGVDPKRNNAWKNVSFGNYADYASTEPAVLGFDHLEELARDRRVAYMCAEAVPWRCHRTIISDVMTVRGWTVEHIMSAGVVRTHVLGAWGPQPYPIDIVTDETISRAVIYPADQPALTYAN